MRQLLTAFLSQTIPFLRRPSPTAFGYGEVVDCSCGVLYDANTMGAVYLDYRGGILGAKTIWICNHCHDELGRGTLLPRLSSKGKRTP